MLGEWTSFELLYLCAFSCLNNMFSNCAILVLNVGIGLGLLCLVPETTLHRYWGLCQSRATPSQTLTGLDPTAFFHNPYFPILNFLLLRYTAKMFPSGGSTEWIQRLQEQEYYVDLIGSSSSEGGAGTEEFIPPTDPINYSLIFTLFTLSILFVVGMCILCVRMHILFRPPV